MNNIDKAKENKRIAKNTIVLYIRMLISLCIGLYTSRIILQTLGVTDFGIYNIVGGTVSLFSFLNTSMSGATARFLTYEIGTGNQTKLKETFGAALAIHFGIALLVIVLAECIGLWFINNQLVIPDGRLQAATWAFHFSVLTMAVTITQVPYNACIIAHEKMDIYAYIEMFNVILKLVLVFLLILYGGDKLILYSILMFCSSFLIAMLYRLYGYKTYAECKSMPFFNKKLITPMLTFSGWDLYGNISTIARTQGVNILLNMFFGPAVNAAGGIASQVQGIIMGFAGNIVTAVKPQIIKSYASNEYERMVTLLFNASKITFLLLLLLSLPLIIEMKFILSIWLGEVPEHAVNFCIFTLLFNFSATMSIVVVTAAHATQRIKRPSIINGTLYLLVIPLSYIAFKSNASPEFSYIFNVLAVTIGLISNVYTVSIYIPNFKFKEFINIVLLRALVVLTISATISLWIKNFFPSDSILQFIIVSLTTTTTVMITGYFLLLDKNLQKKVNLIIINKLCKKN